MEHKDLRELLAAMIRAAKLSFEKTSTLLPFAAALNDQGKIRQLAFPERNRSAEEMSRSIEAGLKVVAHQLTCKAVAFCSEVRFPNGSQAASHAEIVFLLEHRDGCAYRVVIEHFLASQNRNEQRTASRFFARANSFSARTRW